MRDLVSVRSLICLTDLRLTRVFFFLVEGPFRRPPFPPICSTIVRLGIFWLGGQYYSHKKMPVRLNCVNLIYSGLYIECGIIVKNVIMILLGSE